MYDVVIEIMIIIGAGITRLESFVLNLLKPESRPDDILPVMGILPLLVIANSFEKAVAIGSVCLLAMVMTGVFISALRNLLPLELRLIAVLLVAAAVLSLIHVGMQYWFYDISQALGLYLPLIAVNCLILTWAEEYALRHGVMKSLFNTLRAGLCVFVIVIVIGLIREYAGLSLLKQPAGAFLVFGLLFAMHRFAGNLRRQAD